MSEWIGAYKKLTPMQTAGSGSARWCIASRGLERFFLKEFLSPVYPVKEDTELGRLQRKRCERFETQKRRLYAAISCVIGDTLVPVTDFFCFERRYYAVSEAAADSHVKAEEAENLTDEEKRQVLFELALCLQRLHTQGVIHADLKPEHVLLLRKPEGYSTRLIDLDSGFLQDDPPQGDIEGDPVYLAPEVFLKLAGEDVSLGPGIDTFAFGTMIHQLWAGELPAFDHERYHYLYEAVLNGAEIRLSDALPGRYHRTVRRMLSARPEDRPSDAVVTAMFDAAPSWQKADEAQMLNGLSRYMRKETLR